MFVLTSRRERARARERESFIRKLFYNGGSRASPAGVRITIGFYKTSTHPESAASGLRIGYHTRAEPWICASSERRIPVSIRKICFCVHYGQNFAAFKNPHKNHKFVRAPQAKQFFFGSCPRCAAVVPPAQNPPTAPAGGGIFAAVVSPAQRCSLHLQVDLY